MVYILYIIILLYIPQNHAECSKQHYVYNYFITLTILTNKQAFICYIGQAPKSTIKYAVE